MDGGLLPLGLTALATAIDEVAVGPVWSLSDALLADEVGLVYAASQRWQARLLALVGEADGRGLAGRLGATNTASWLMFSLACSRREASQAVELARALISSAALETTASALAVGDVNVEQARVIAATLRDLPDEVGVEGKARCGKLLTELAVDRVRPEVLAAHKSMILEQVAPEIAEEALRRELERAERTAYERRGLTFSKYGEGEYRVRGILPTEAAAIVRAALDPLCAPGRNLPGAADPAATGCADHAAASAATGCADHAAAFGLVPAFGHAAAFTDRTTATAAGSAFAPPTVHGSIDPGGGSAFGIGQTGACSPIGEGSRDGIRAGDDHPAAGTGPVSGSRPESKGSGDVAPAGGGRTIGNPEGAPIVDGYDQASREGSGDVTDPQTIAARDPRTAAARRADALTELCRRALAHGDLPDNGGEKPHLVITMSWQQLRDSTAGALLDTGDLLTPAAARRLACDALIIPAVLGGQSQPLDLGRARRLIDGPLRRALVLRDRGCAFPGCERPPAWCDGHHIRSWADGGETSLTNAVLLCGHHHRVIHRGEWSVHIGPSGHPEFTPPDYIDRERKPLRNNLH